MSAAAPLSGWGRHPVRDCRLETLHDARQLDALLDAAPTLIPRGAGRAYGDAALNPALTLSMLAQDRLLAFDPDSGRLTCEAGATLADILNVFVPRGWFPPVLPGTKFVTVGGMVAADVHGKNHHQDGSFGAHVESLTLVAADGGTRTLSREQNSDLFWATVGGMGLTGVIIDVTFRLVRIPSAYLNVETVPTQDLDETMARFEESANWPYSVAWLDALARGPAAGRGLLTRATFMAHQELPAPLASAPLRGPGHPLASIPMPAPKWLLNRPWVKCFNEGYYQLGRRRSGHQPTHFDPFFFPLDRVGALNRLAGRPGFAQHQSALPKATSAAALAAMLATVAASHRGAYLAVLKLFGPAGDGLLSFPMEGYTLALDIPMRHDTAALLDALDGIVSEHGGRIYLAKDAHCSAPRLRAGYPRLNAFATTRTQAAGTPPKFASELSRRLEL